MENTELQEKINLASDKIVEVKNEVHKKIVGQDDLIESLIVGLLSKGHILIE
jgi:MoxR-like ATPase